MTYGGKALKDKKTLKYYKVQNDRTIMLEGRHDKYLPIKPIDPTLTKLSERLGLELREDKSAYYISAEGIVEYERRRRPSDPSLDQLAGGIQRASVAVGDGVQ